MPTPASESINVVLITGAAHRIGAQIAKCLHAQGMNIVLHYRSSSQAAQALAEGFNNHRHNSAITLQADLLDTASLPKLIEQAHQHWGRLDAVVNNASSFYPTAMGEITEQHWDDLMGSNLKAPLFLAQTAAPLLKKQGGCIVNIVDIHAQKPLKNHPVYCIAKAGLHMLTLSLARELGPEIRVNGVAPGAILWPEAALNSVAKQQIVDSTALKRQGNPNDIATTVLFMIRDAPYITGQVLSVDGGRTLSH